MIIRPLRADERALWKAMRRRLFPDCDEAVLAYEETRALSQPDTRFAVLIAAAGEEVAGFVEVAVRSRVDGALSDEVGYVEGGYVEEAWRGQGVGRRLVAAAEAWARARGLTEMASDTEIDNAESIAAHQALGFRETFRIVQFLKPIMR